MKKLRRFIYDLFHKNKEDLKGTIYRNTIYTNDYVNLVHDACVISHGGSPDDRTEEKKEFFISKIIKMQHESVIEHSNIIQCYKFSSKYSEDLAEIIPALHYLYPKVKVIDGTINMLIGGSIRGYKYFVRNVSNLSNPIFKAILSEMYNIKSCFFEDLINDGIMNKDSFTDVVIGDSNDYDDQDRAYYKYIIKKDRYEISSHDDITVIKILCDNTFGKDVFSIDDILDVSSVTVLFKDMSRIISQQLTRHRNAITQLSQRYVDYSDVPFNPPYKFRPDLYNEDQEYTINISDGNNTAQFKFTQQSLGDEICKIYPQLREQGLKIEDARAYLPNNVVTSLYMTFTYRNLIKFLQLRVDKSAQAEIRETAIEIEKDLYIFSDLSNIYSYLDPKYKESDPYDEIDEIIEE